MTDERPVTRRGVYKDLSLSPYEFNSPYGDLFKFSSAKKLEIYSRDIPKEVDRVKKLITRHGLNGFIPPEIEAMLYRAMYKAFYSKVEG